ncbi:S-layer homology domain-containing protein [Egicoccus sp. AB-alg2]|uniref:S-layer homology domain-containing protein n=1 Tax=Egicoccus sp. AB-alg2 TaxID=3242693 RepID=UPI00359CFDAF
MIRRAFLLLLSVSMLSVPLAPAAVAQSADATVPSPFPDTEGNVHEQAIIALAQIGVTSGRQDGSYGSRVAVRRDQMATFLTNALRYQPTAHPFSDVPSHRDADYPHGGAVGALVYNDVTQGCDVRDPSRFCPGRSITRGQFATMLTRALDLPEGRNPRFTDVPSDHAHYDGIASVAAAGITTGCTQVQGGFCPEDPVRRDQMATFLIAALDLEGPVPCPMVDGTAQFTNTERVAAPLGYPVTAGHWHDGHLVVFPNDLDTPRVARLSGQPGASPAVASWFEQPSGRRTWATAEASGQLWYGVWGAGGNNLHRAGTPAVGTRIDIGTEFWDLATDDQQRLYAAGRAWNVNGALHLPGESAETDVSDRHVLHRVQTEANSIGTPQKLLFRLPPSAFDFRKADAKQVAWHDGEVFVAFGPGTDAARVVRLQAEQLVGQPSSVDQLPVAEDLTPASVQGARDVFALEVTDDWIVIGTMAGGEEHPEARLVVLDRDDPTGPPVIDRPLRRDLADDQSGESRVDAVAVSGDTIVAVGFPSGMVYRAEPATGLVTPTRAPEANTTTRALRIVDGDVEGMSGRGDWWRMPLPGAVPARAEVSRLEGAAPIVGAGAVHSLGIDDGHVYVGTSNRVFAHRHTNGTTPPAPREGDVAGEVKAITTDGQRAYLAIYPSAELWTWTPGSGAPPQKVAAWDGNFNRPRAVTMSDAGDGRVYVVAREDSPEGRHRSQLVVIDPNAPEDQRLVGEYELQSRRPSHGSGLEVEGLSVAAVNGLAVVGEARGEVRALDPDTGDEVWPDPRGAVRPIGNLPIRTLDVVDGVVVAINEQGRWAELDPRTGRTVAQSRHSSLSGTELVWDSVSFGPVTVAKRPRGLVGLDRAADTVASVRTHQVGRTFTADTEIVADANCRMHFAVGRFLQTLPYDPKTRLHGS